MSGDAGYSVEIVRFAILEAGATFASALLGEGGCAGFVDHALKRFTALSSG